VSGCWFVIVDRRTATLRFCLPTLHHLDPSETENGGLVIDSVNINTTMYISYGVENNSTFGRDWIAPPSAETLSSLAVADDFIILCVHVCM
jgi:hypothetical protein